MIVWIASYPRSGNTLLRTMLRQVFHIRTYSKYNDAEDIGQSAEISEKVGHISYDGNWPDAYRAFLDSKETFFIKTHEAPCDENRCIYIVRNGYEALQSREAYEQGISGRKCSYENLVTGLGIPFPSWGSHLDAWNPLTRSDTLLLKYEDLLSAPSSQIDKISSFLKKNPLAAWSNPFEQLKREDPLFFRKGTNCPPSGMETPERKMIFDFFHGDWMCRLGYLETKTVATHCFGLRKTIDCFIEQTESINSDQRNHIRSLENENRRLSALLLVRRGDIQWARKDWKGALETWEKVLKQQPDCLDAFAARASALSEIGNANEALQCLEAGLQAHPRNEWLLGLLGQLLLNLQKWDQALVHLETALQAHPRSEQLLGLFGQLLLNLQKWDQALVHLEAALQVHPRSEWLLGLFGQLLLNLQKWDQALVHLEAALQAHPRSEWLFGLFGQLLLNLQRWDQALVHLEAALQVHPRSEQLLGLFGQLLLNLQRWDQALAHLEAALQVHPRSEQLLGLLGELLLNLQRWDQALVHLEAALQAHPRSEQLLGLLGQLLLTLQKWDEALVHLKAALQTHPRSEWLLGMFGQLLVNLKRWDEALVHLEAGLRAYPRSEWLLGLLSECYTEQAKALRMLGDSPELKSVRS